VQTTLAMRESLAARTGTPTRAFPTALLIVVSVEWELDGRFIRDLQGIGELRTHEALVVIESRVDEVAEDFPVGPLRRARPDKVNDG
jgi:hypothetical protein